MTDQAGSNPTWTKGYSFETHRQVSHALRLGMQGLSKEVRESIEDVLVDVDPEDLDALIATLHCVLQNLLAVGATIQMSQFFAKYELADLVSKTEPKIKTSISKLPTPRVALDSLGDCEHGVSWVDMPQSHYTEFHKNDHP